MYCVIGFKCGRTSNDDIDERIVARNRVRPAFNGFSSTPESKVMNRTSSLRSVTCLTMQASNDGTSEAVWNVLV